MAWREISMVIFHKKDNLRNKIIFCLKNYLKLKHKYYNQ